jgi:hypothetical protein
MECYKNANFLLLSSSTLADLPKKYKLICFSKKTSIRKHLGRKRSHKKIMRHSMNSLKLNTLVSL